MDELIKKISSDIANLHRRNAELLVQIDKLNKAHKSELKDMYEKGKVYGKLEIAAQAMNKEDVRAFLIDQHNMINSKLVYG